MKKSGFVQERKYRKTTPVERINAPHQALAPNDIWTVDFKGWWYSKDRSRCEPLTIRDEFSCFVLEAGILGSTRTEDVKSAFERTFKLYGLPRVIKSDNGSPFASAVSVMGMKCPGDVYQKSERVYTSEKTQNRVSVILQGTETRAFGLFETGSQQYLYQYGSCGGNNWNHRS